VDGFKHGILITNVCTSRRTHAALNLSSLVSNDIAIKVGQHKDLELVPNCFVNQVGSAIGTGVLGFTLIVSGINDISEKVANAATEAEANLLIAATPDSAIWIMKLAMMIFPLICIVAGFIIYMKKFKIDETTYAKIVEDLEARNSLSESKDGVADSEVVIDEVHS
jgi:hypothetical protein